MIELSDLILVAVLAWLGWYAFQVAQVKETTIKAVEQYCQQHDVMLLDATVALNNLGFARDSHGWLRIRRRYGFEFTATGEDRNVGEATVFGGRLQSVELAPHRIH